VLGAVSSPQAGSVVVSGDRKTFTYSAPLNWVGRVELTYQHCNANGCNGSVITIRVDRPLCTISSAGEGPVVGTSGNDVICIDSDFAFVDSGAGDDIVIVRGVAEVNLGDGTDLLVVEPSSVALLSGENPEEIQSDGTVYGPSGSLQPPVEVPPTEIDRQAPEVTISIPEQVFVGQPSSAAVFCTDDQGGATCPESVALDTTTTGRKFVTVTATDTAGNATSATESYLVKPIAVQLYRVRNGDSARGEIAMRIFLERNTALSGLGDYDPDGDGWALVARTNGDGDNGLIARFSIDPMFVTTRHAQKGCLQLAPVSIAVVKKGQTRLFFEVAQNTALCRTAPNDADTDNNGIPDNAQPLYRARNGDTSKGEVAARVYIERNVVSAEAQIGVSDYDPDKDGWALVGRSNGFTDDGIIHNYDSTITGITVRVAHPTQGCKTLSRQV
jgi:hypothetical protein